MIVKYNQNANIFTTEAKIDFVRQVKERVKTGFLLGECEFYARRSVVTLEKVSHIVNDADIADNEMRIDITLLRTVRGKSALELIFSGIEPTFAVRFDGIHQNGIVLKLDRLISCDLIF